MLSDDARDVEVEAAPSSACPLTCCRSGCLPGSKLAGVEIGELRLPVGASVSLVVRDGTTFVPHRTDRLSVHDDLLIVAARNVREQTEERLRAVGRHGRLAGWT